MHTEGKTRNAGRVGQLRSDGRAYKLMNDEQESLMMTLWFMGVKPKVVRDMYGLSARQFYSLLYRDAKRVMQPFFDKALGTFREGGSTAVMRRFDLELRDANRMMVRVMGHDSNPASRNRNPRKR